MLSLQNRETCSVLGFFSDHLCSITKAKRWVFIPPACSLKCLHCLSLSNRAQEFMADFFDKLRDTDRRRRLGLARIIDNVDLRASVQALLA